jgi:hypothetical protein
MKIHMITVIFVLDCFNRPAPSYAYNTRYKGRILYRTTIRPDQTIETLLEPLYKHSRVTPAWTFWWNDLYACDVTQWPSGMYGAVYGKNENEELMIYCREPY